MTDDVSDGGRVDTSNDGGNGGRVDTPVEGTGRTGIPINGCGCRDGAPDEGGGGGSRGGTPDEVVDGGGSRDGAPDEGGSGRGGIPADVDIDGRRVVMTDDAGNADGGGSVGCRTGGGGNDDVRVDTTDGGGRAGGGVVFRLSLDVRGVVATELFFCQSPFD